MASRPHTSLLRTRAAWNVPGGVQRAGGACTCSTNTLAEQYSSGTALTHWQSSTAAAQHSTIYCSMQRLELKSMHCLRSAYTDPECADCLGGCAAGYTAAPERAPVRAPSLCAIPGACTNCHSAPKHAVPLPGSLPPSLPATISFPPAALTGTLASLRICITLTTFWEALAQPWAIWWTAARLL
jgi:hypothetical protein